ncbi:MAG TPA: hypothetical protein PLK77_19105, partial [Pyrinomonadaceae bacterium]|nr:hypothetical protein [Pyrinomonadaceae bacterium]
LAPLALTMLIGVYIYSLWSQERLRNAEIPVDATGTMSRDLLKFHQKRGSFPAKLKDLEGVVWEEKDRNFVSDGRSLIHRNYFYLYSRIDSHQFTLWAIPIGKQRDEASTFFLVGAPQKNRIWKGPPVPIADIDKLSSTPASAELVVLGFAERKDLHPSSNSK